MSPRNVSFAYSPSPNQTMSDSVDFNKTFCILGAGIAGIVTAKTLLEEGFQNISIIEQHSSLGGVWAAGRTYPLLSSNSPRGHYSFSDHPLHDTSKPGQWLFAEEIREGLEDYAQQHDVKRRISFRTRVVQVQEIGVDGQPGPDSNGVHRTSGWWIYTTALSPTEIDEAQPLSAYLVPEHLKPKPDLSSCAKQHTDVLIVCTGLFSRPIVPQIDGMDQFKGLAVHSSDIPKSGNVDKILDIQKSGKHVVVLGMGKSASDLADWLGQEREKLVKQGKEVPQVTILFRRPHWFLPLPFFTTLDYSGLLGEIGLFTRQLVLTLPPNPQCDDRAKSDPGGAPSGNPAKPPSSAAKARRKTWKLPPPKKAAKKRKTWSRRRSFLLKSRSGSSLG